MAKSLETDPLLMHLEDFWQGAPHRPTYIPTMVLIVSSGRAWRAGTSHRLLIFCLTNRSSGILIRQDNPTLVVFGSV